MPRLQDLPNEILDRIFTLTVPIIGGDDEVDAFTIPGQNMAYKTPKAGASQDSLDWAESCDIIVNLCLVSRRFRDIAQPLLFSEYHDDGTSTGDFSMFLKFTKALFLRPDLGEKVKLITLYPIEDDFEWNMDVSAEDEAFFTPIIKGFNLASSEEEYWLKAMRKLDLSLFVAMLVTKTPNLRELALPADCFFMPPLNQLLARNPSLLKNLDQVWLKGDSDKFEGYTMQAFEQFFTLPNMKRPVIEYGNLTSMGYPETWTPGSLATEDVAFIDCHMDVSSIEKFTKACRCLKAFTFRSWYPNTIRIRDTRAVDPKLFTIPQALDALLTHKNTLESLHIELPRTLEEGGTAEAVQGYTRSTEQIGHLRDFVALKSILLPHVVLPAKPEFPPNIEEIHISDCNASIRDQVAHLAAAVKRNEYPALKDVVFTAIDVSRPVKLSGQLVPPGKTPWDMMKSLRDLFDGTGVEFNVEPVVLDGPDDDDLFDDIDPERLHLGGFPGGLVGGHPPGTGPDGRPPMPPEFLEYFMARAREDPDLGHLFRD